MFCDFPTKVAVDSNEGCQDHVEELIEEMNHDTITSLRNFVESAQYVKRASEKQQQHNRSPQVSSRSSSFSEAEREQAAASSRAASIHGGDTEVRRNNAWSFARKLSLRSKYYLLLMIDYVHNVYIST